MLIVIMPLPSRPPFTGGQYDISAWEKYDIITLGEHDRTSAAAASAALREGRTPGPGYGLFFQQAPPALAIDDIKRIHEGR